MPVLVASNALIFSEAGNVTAPENPFPGVGEGRTTPSPAPGNADEGAGVTRSWKWVPARQKIHRFEFESFDYVFRFFAICISTNFNLSI